MIISAKEQSEHMLAQAHELREAAEKIEQGDFSLGELCAFAGRHRARSSVVGSVKTEVEIRDRCDQLLGEWLDRVEARLNGSSPEMLDQAQVLRRTANDLESGKIGFDDLTSVFAALCYAHGFDYGYQRFMKDRRRKILKLTRTWDVPRNKQKS